MITLPGLVASCAMIAVTTHAVITSSHYRRFHIDADLSMYKEACMLQNTTNIELPEHSSLFIWQHCSKLCLTEATCTFFFISSDYTRCLMFYFELYPLYDNPTAANSLEAYMRHTPGLISSGDIDLAFLKPISASSSFAGYNPPSLLTNGFECQTDPMQCFCTANGGSSLSVDLGSSQLVTKVIIRGSLDYDKTYVNDDKITVGDNQDADLDQEIGRIVEAAGIDFEIYEFENIGIIGQYVTIKQTSGYALCICNIKVY